MFIRTLVVLLSLLLSDEGQACLRHHTPAVYEASEFSRIFLGEITGIHLSSYESYRLAELHPPRELVSDEDLDLSDIYPTSSTPHFEVDAIVLETFVGRRRKSGEFSLGGCGVKVPALKSRALFFVTREGATVAVPESSEEFQRWLEFARARTDSTKRQIGR